MHKKIVIITVLLVGSLLKLIHFPDIPPGLQPDEAALGHEAFSLLENGTDKWGNKWPVYFPGLGTGQSVLLAYISIPFIKTFGLSTFSIRIVPLIIGIITSIIFYISVKHAFKNKAIALSATSALLFLPWHFMLSRWSLDANLLPFTILIGITTINLALSKKWGKRKKWLLWILSLISAVSFSASFYSYGISILITPMLLILIFLFYKKKFTLNIGTWVVSGVLFLITSLPFFLFLIKNYITHHNLPLEHYLPFSIPLLLASRYDQASGNMLQNLIHNSLFLLGGFNDHLIWNTNEPFLPLGIFPLPFILTGSVILINKLIVTKKTNIYLLWLLSCSPLLLLVKLNVNRGNAILLPAICIGSYGAYYLYSLCKRKKIKILYLMSIVGVSIISSYMFLLDYFFFYPNKASSAFKTDLNAALESSMTQNSPIFLSENVPLNYTYVLFYLKVSPKNLRINGSYTIKNDRYIVSRYKNIYFKKESILLKKGERIRLIVTKYESTSNICQQGSTKIIYTNSHWDVLECFFSKNNAK